MKRHNARIIAVMTLYNVDINNEDESMTDIIMNEIIDMEKSNEYPVEIDFKFTQEVIAIVLKEINSIDDVIVKNLKNWTIDRLSYVDRALIRIATGEMMYTKTPKEIIINEALDITKEYSSIDGNEQVKFNNRLLDNIAKDIYG